MVVVALQELVDLKDVTNYLQTVQSEDAIARWTKAILECLRNFYRHPSRARAAAPEASPSAPQFSPLKAHCLVGTGLVVIVRTQLLRNVRELKWSEVSFGTLGVLGNKGAVGIRFRYILPISNEAEGEDDVAEGARSVTMCFVGCHLTAHQNQIEKRNQDLSQIETRLRFKLTSRERRQRIEMRRNKELGPIAPLKREASFEAFEEDFTLGSSSSSAYATEIGILNHDLVFVLGDLNYRLDFPSKREVVARLRRGQIKELLSRDQLTRERRSFTLPLLDARFKEAPISFPPTYKYVPGTILFEGGDENEDREEEEIGALVVGGGRRPPAHKRPSPNTNQPASSSSSSNSKRPPRIPSYCDRVFYRTNVEGEWPVLVGKYYSSSTILASDHKPVACQMDLPTVSVGGGRGLFFFRCLVLRHGDEREKRDSSSLGHVCSRD